MRKVVNGKYDDPNSTRSIFQISEEEFDLIKESVVHLSNKYSFFIDASEEELRSIVGFSGNIGDFKRDIINDMEAIKALEVRIMTLVLSSSNEIPEMTPHEFRVLVESVANYCSDITNAIDMDADAIKAAAKGAMSISEKVVSESEINKALDEITSEEYKKKVYEKSKILYSIFEVINEPHEGEECYDEMGEKEEPSQEVSSSDTN